MRAACRGAARGTAGLCRDPRGCNAALEANPGRPAGLPRWKRAGGRGALGSGSALLRPTGLCQGGFLPGRQSTEVCPRLLAASEGQDCPKIAQTAELGAGGHPSAESCSATDCSHGLCRVTQPGGLHAPRTRWGCRTERAGMLYRFLRAVGHAAEAGCLGICQMD